MATPHSTHRPSTPHPRSPRGRRLKLILVQLSALSNQAADFLNDYAGEIPSSMASTLHAVRWACTAAECDLFSDSRFPETLGHFNKFRKWMKGKKKAGAA